MKTVFIDSSGFFALLAKEDESHERAAQVFALADEEAWALVTTNTVVVETYALLLNRTRDGRRHAIAFLDHLDETDLKVERVTEFDERKAIEVVRQHRDKTYSLCDAQSFVVMQRLKMREAITADDHFRQYGYITLL